MALLAAGALRTASSVVFTLGALGAADYQIDPSDSFAGLSFLRDGTYVGVGNSDASLGAWITPRTSTSGDAYEIYFHVTSGSTPGGAAMDTWLALSTTRVVSLTRTTIGADVSSLTVQIRRVSDSVVVASGTIELSSVVDT